MATKELLVSATGRRKVSIARVRLKPGTHKLHIKNPALALDRVYPLTVKAKDRPTIRMDLTVP